MGRWLKGQGSKGMRDKRDRCTGGEREGNEQQKVVMRSGVMCQRRQLVSKGESVTWSLKMLCDDRSTQGERVCWEYDPGSNKGSTRSSRMR